MRLERVRWREGNGLRSERAFDMAFLEGWKERDLPVFRFIPASRFPLRVVDHPPVVFHALAV